MNLSSIDPRPLLLVGTEQRSGRVFINVKVREYQGAGLYGYGTVRYARVWKVFGFVVWKQWLGEPTRKGPFDASGKR